MATVTHRVATASTVDGTSFTSGSFTPAVGDLLVAVIGSTGSAINGTMTDTQSLGWHAAIGAVTGGRRLRFFVANTEAAASSMTVTWDTTGDDATGCVIFVASIAGTSRVGSDAVRQVTFGTGTADAPDVTFGAACLTTNPTIVAAENTVNPAALTPPTNWTERGDSGFATPANGVEYASRDSGFTATTITWGSAAGADHVEIAIEIDASVNVPLQAADALSDTTLALNAPTEIALGASDAASSATLVAEAPTQVPLDAAAGQSAATLATSAITQIPLQAADALSVAALTLDQEAFVLLDTASAQSSATLVFVVPAGLPFDPAAAVSSATLEIGIPGDATLTLDPAAASSAASLVLIAAELAEVVSYSLKRHDFFPVGTTVGLYRRTAWMNDPQGAPTKDPIDTQEMTIDGVTFLQFPGRYFAAAEVEVWDSGNFDFQRRVNEWRVVEV